MFPYRDMTMDSIEMKILMKKFKGINLKYENAQNKISFLKQKRKSLQEMMVIAQKSRIVVQKVARLTQRNLEERISKVVTLALKGVFEEPYKFIVKFEERRNRTEAKLLFKRYKKIIGMMDAVGGGVCDVASFALRCAFLKFERKQIRPVMILDEPFRFVSVDLQERCSKMLRNISQKLGIQIIMISHLPKIITEADRLFKVRMKEGVSSISDITNQM